jgi:hypothetical protein
MERPLMDGEDGVASIGDAAMDVGGGGGGEMKPAKRFSSTL